MERSVKRKAAISNSITRRRTNYSLYVPEILRIPVLTATALIAEKRKVRDSRDAKKSSGPLRSGNDRDDADPAPSTRADANPAQYM